MKTELKHDIIQHLTRVNRDLAQAFKEDPSGAKIDVQIFPFGEGIFTRRQEKIKNKYLVQTRTEVR